MGLNVRRTFNVRSILTIDQHFLKNTMYEFMMVVILMKASNLRISVM